MWSKMKVEFLSSGTLAQPLTHGLTLTSHGLPEESRISCRFDVGAEIWLESSFRAWAEGHRP